MAHVIDAVMQLRDEFSTRIETMSNKLTKAHKDMLRAGRQIERTGKDLMKVGSGLTKSVTLPLVGIAAAAVKVGIDMEDAFSGVKKTVSGTPEQLLAVKRELDTLATQSIPVARKELYGIAETAGQLGVAREHIIGFTETVARIGRVTNLSYEEGSAALARFANIMGMPMDQMDRLGSTIVKLDNSLATSAAEIVDMGMRLAGAGRQAGLTEAQVLGLAGALSSVGLESQAGGSAFSKVLLNMNSAVFKGGEELRRFAKVAGVTTTEFAAAWREDAAGATAQFVQGLNKLKSEGKNVTGIIEGLGFTELRTRDALLRATEASGLFTAALDTGSKAWTENTALQEVFATRTDNTAAKIDLMKNKLGLASEKLAVSLMPAVGTVIDSIGRLADRFAAMSPAQQEMIVRMAATAAAIGPVLMGVGKLTRAVGGAITTVGNIGKAIKKAGGVMQWLMSPGHVVTMVIAGIALAAYLIIKHWDKIGPFFARVWGYVKPVFDWLGKGIAWVGWAFGDAAAWLKDAWGGISAFFGAAGVKIVGVWDWLKTTAGNIVAGIVERFNDMKTKLKSIFDGIASFVAPFINPLIAGINLLIRGLNKISFDVPKWVPLIGGKKWGFNIPEIPKLARGTDYHRGGPALVGERGPELVILPRATRVIPADDTARIMRESTMSVRQRLIPAVIPAMTDQVQWIRQAVVAATVPAIRDQVQHIVQVIVPTVASAPAELMQVVRQQLVEVAIPAVRDQVQWIRQHVATAVVPATADRVQHVTQMIRQQLLAMTIPAVHDQVQQITQMLVPVLIEAPMAMVQTIRQQLIAVTIPAVHDQAQVIRQQVIAAMLPDMPSRQQTIRQVLVEAETPRPQTIRQIVERSQQTQPARTRRDDDRASTRQQAAPFLTWAPVFNLGPVSCEVDARKLLSQIEDIVEDAAHNMPRTALEGA